MRGVAFFLLAALPAVPELAAAEVSDRPELPFDLSRGPARTRAGDAGFYARTFAELALGKGLRFNNPYRLATPVGDRPESVSLSAAYLDVGVGAAFGPFDGLQHGASVSLSVATDGIAQEVVSLSYLALWPVRGDVLLRARGGVPIVIEPDANVGLELGAGGVWLFTGGLGVTAELVGSLFYGAGTLDKSITTIPLLSLELGLWFDYEVLP